MEAETALLELKNSEVILRQQIAASDDLLKQNAAQQLDLQGKIDHARNRREKEQLQAKLRELKDQETEFRKRRDNVRNRSMLSRSRQGSGWANRGYAGAMEEREWRRESELL